MKLSHPSTFLFKFVWPCGWLGLIGTFLGRSLLGAPVRWGPGVTPFWGNIVLTVLFVVGLLVLITLSIPLKTAQLSGASLHLSNYLSNDTVPLANISRIQVTGDFARNGGPSVTVWFRQPTRYGSKIVFLASSRDALTTFLDQLGDGVEIRRV